jgi:hypothetical protein
MNQLVSLYTIPGLFHMFLKYENDLIQSGAPLGIATMGLVHPQTMNHTQQ